jgi:hypothetical protein
MDTSGEFVTLAPPMMSQRDLLIRRGVRYGLLVKRWQSEKLTPAESALLGKVTPQGSTMEAGPLIMAPEEAAIALAALERNKVFLKRSDSWGDDDIIAWGAIPEISDFVIRHGIDLAAE